MTDIEPFISLVAQVPTFRSPLAPLTERIRERRAKFMLDLWSTVKCRGVKSLSFDESREAVGAGEVKIHFLAPEREFLSKEFERLHRFPKDKRRAPDPNRSSLVLGLEYRGTLILLGGDALRAGWRTAYKKWLKNKLPKAGVLKIPHHSGENAFDLAAATGGKKPVNCWDLCVKKPIAIIFAGDFQHPDPEILQILEARTELHSFFDLQESVQRQNPLRLHTIGARAVDQSLRPQNFCKIIVEVDSNGKVQLIHH